MATDSSNTITITDYTPMITAAVVGGLTYFWKKNYKWAIGGALLGYLGGVAYESSKAISSILSAPITTTTQPVASSSTTMKMTSTPSGQTQAGTSVYTDAATQAAADAYFLKINGLTPSYITKLDPLQQALFHSNAVDAYNTRNN